MPNKRGSAMVFLSFILSAMVLLTAAFVYIAREKALSGYGDGLFGLAARSILSEFNVELKDRYGIFVFEKNGTEVQEDIRNYMNYSLQPNDYARLEEVKIRFGDHSLGNPEVLKKQILDDMKFAIGKAWPNQESEQNPVIKDTKNRTLRNRAIIESLPSRPLKEDFMGFTKWVKEIAAQIGSLEEIFDKTKEHYLIDRYILTHFRCKTVDLTGNPTFFGNEVEYILEGEYNNTKNYENVRRGLVLFRGALNAAYLYMDPERRAETLAAAELLTPGPAAAVTQTVIIGTWSLAEAENDALLLEKNKPVALFKDKKTWATDLESVLKNREKGCIDTGSKSGLDYDEYLMIFLHFQDEKTKLMRVMDLIQLNMKGTCDKDFLIKTCNTGFKLQGKLNGKEYSYDATY